MTWLEDVKEKFRYSLCSYCSVWLWEKCCIFWNWLRGNGTIRIRDISYEQSKKEIIQYFDKHDGDKITEADLEDTLNIDFWVCYRVCEELRIEGEIE